MRRNEITVTDVQHFCMHDGPGVRTTVFFKGCPLSCLWCHNPETRKTSPEVMLVKSACIGCGACAVCPKGLHRITPVRSYDRASCTACGLCAGACPTGALKLSGKRMTADEIIAEVMADAPFYGADGGLTVSGGEPTFQSEGLVALLSEAKKNGITTAVETCGVFSSALVPRLVPLVDTWLYDVKDTDEARLKANTGADLARIVGNLRMIDEAGGVSVMRCVLIPDVNMTAEHASKLAELYHSLCRCRYIELLPYHPYGTSKAEQIDEAEAVFRKPERDDVVRFADALKQCGIAVKCYGSMA